MEDILNAIEVLCAECRISGETPDYSTNYREAYERLVALIRSYGDAREKVGRANAAAYLERRAAEIEDGQDVASPAAWMARILRDEAKAIRDTP